jgi:murein DD-endopeptidase MepM/ murein hydrolase activator NlpD
VVPVNPTINAGTAGLQYLYALLLGYEQWNNAITANGVQETYIRLFDYPFFYSYDPLIPPALTQPTLQLPFEKGEAWSFTGGPHGGWDNGSAWAALDFAPPSDALGCVQSDEWVVAVADGLIVRVGEGAVIQDLDMDGLEQTGWTVLYMHIETRDRIREGARVKAGDRIGHPSCEGGISTGTHLHLARRYNGEWIPADQSTIPFVMDSWTSVGTGSLYDGFLIREDGRQIEALNGREEFNQIQR